MSPVLTGLDWGTSALRAYLIGPGGAVLERRESGHGLRALPAGGFPEAFAAAIRDWPALPVLMAGMVGARTGWAEAPYCDLSEGPVGVTHLAARLTAVPAPAAASVHIVPGVMRRGIEGADVMRGEETQVMGLDEGADGPVLLPGTHCKWVELQDGRIAAFRTAMTGELFAAVSRHTILADTLEEAASPEEAAAGFAEGLALAKRLERPGDLLHRLFGIRAAVLCGDLAATRAGDLLSGLLIGAEVAALAADRPVQVLGTDALAERYATALTFFGVAHDLAPPDATPKGLYAVARAAALLAEPAPC
jgi:2-dehydro-3-deoxygalactonokinase